MNETQTVIMWSVTWSIIAVVADPDMPYSMQHLTYETA